MKFLATLGSAAVLLIQAFAFFFFAGILIFCAVVFIQAI